MIDADKIKQSVTNKMLKEELDSPAYCALEGMVEDIDNQPTAYNVFRVMEQINNLIKPTEQYRHNFCSTVTDDDCSNYDACEFCIARKIIEIVKSGGV